MNIRPITIAPSRPSFGSASRREADIRKQLINGLADHLPKALEVTKESLNGNMGSDYYRNMTLSAQTVIQGLVQLLSNKPTSD